MSDDFIEQQVWGGRRVDRAPMIARAVFAARFVRGAGGSAGYWFWREKDTGGTAAILRSVSPRGANE